MLSLFKKKKKTIQLDLCSNNFDRFMNADTNYRYFEKLAQHKQIILKEYDCLNNCKQCANTPYIIMNGKKYSHDSSEKLLGQLKKTLYDEFNID